MEATIDQEYLLFLNTQIKIPFLKAFIEHDQLPILSKVFVLHYVLFVLLLSLILLKLFPIQYDILAIIFVFLLTIIFIDGLFHFASTIFVFISLRFNFNRFAYMFKNQKILVLYLVYF